MGRDSEVRCDTKAKFVGNLLEENFGRVVYVTPTLFSEIELLNELPLTLTDLHSRSTYLELEHTF